MDWKSGPPLLIGEKVWWKENADCENQSGIIRWIGSIPEFGPGWTVGIELDHASISLGNTCDGIWKNRKLFECQERHGVLAPIYQVKKQMVTSSSKEWKTKYHTDQNLDFFQESDFAQSAEKSCNNKGKEKSLKPRNSLLESKFSEWAFKNRRNAYKKNESEKLPVESKVNFSLKSQNGKLSLRRNERKRKSLQEIEAQDFEDTFEAVRQSLDKYSYFTINQAFEPPDYLENSKSSMKDVGSSFKIVKEDDGKNGGQHRKGLNDLLPKDLRESSSSIHSQKEKKIFSFLKWFKKNKENQNVQNTKESSEESSPLFQRKRGSSCESVDTIFSTQTVRSFAYIPSTQYLPSAPPSTLLDLDRNRKCFEYIESSNVTRDDEAIYDRKKKRKAPVPPRLKRENSLPTSLERKKTYYRRAVSESLNDEKSVAYCHVQGKRRAPPPPVPALYPNLQRLGSQTPSLQKKKKPAPAPPAQISPRLTKGIREDPSSTHLNKCIQNHQDFANGIVDNEDRLKPENQADDVSSSPLPSRPWYKRSHRESTGSNLIKKELLKGFDKKKNKEAEEWMPEIGYPRTNESSGHGKFNFFSKLDKNEDRKREEKRKSQISILTNISELDKEAAEIVRRAQEEERKMLNANDDKFYSPNSPQSLATMFKNIDETVNDVENRIVPPNERTGRGDSKSRTAEEESALVSKEKKLDRISPEPLEGETEKINGGGSSKISNESEKSATDISRILPLEPMSDANNINFPKTTSKDFNYLNDPWVCLKCTLENPGWRVFCEICSSVKPKFLYNYNVKMEGAVQKVPAENSIKTTSKSKNEATEKKEKVEKHKDEITGTSKIWPSGPAKTDAMTSSKTGRENESKESETRLPIQNQDKSSQVPVGMKEETKQNDESPKGGETSEGNTLREEPDDQQSQGSSVKTQESGISAKEFLKSHMKKNGGRPEEKVIEAYVVTETIVLEDIIIKRADDKKQKSSDVLRAQPKLKKMAGSPLESSTAACVTAKRVQEPIDLSPTAEDLFREKQDLQELAHKLTEAKGLEDFKADMKTMESANTVAANRLLKRLEAAIKDGDQSLAAELAKELALIKINCSITGHSTDTSAMNSATMTVDIYIEDKKSQRGPIRVKVSPAMTLLQLKKKVQQELGFPVELQRWILNKSLEVDDHKTLESAGVKNNSNSVFLYLKAPDKEEPVTKTQNESETKGEKEIQEQTNRSHEHYSDRGWYFNYEKNRYSYCEDESDDDERNPVGGGIPMVEAEFANSKSEARCATSNGLAKESGKVSEEKEVLETIDVQEIPSNVGIRGAENETDSDLKLILVNSVKQKVEQLNRTLAENSRQNKEKLGAQGTKPKHLAGKSPKEIHTNKEETNDFHYQKLMELQDADIVSNVEAFNCPICFIDYPPKKGVTLKDCLHTFCRDCLINTVKYSEDAEVKCPYSDNTYSCTSVLQQREIKALVPQKIFDLHLAKSVKEAENKIDNAFHCKTPDCKGWCIYEDNVNEFQCPVCKYTNCLTCQAIHSGINCKQYQERMKDASDTDVNAKKTRAMLEEMVEKGEALACPKCQVVLMKKWGCDWLKCSMCKTEICWVTKGFRWGPAGKGDTSGGCRCGVNGVKCHAKCNYCH